MEAPRDYAQLADTCLAAVERWVLGLNDDALDCTRGDGLLVLEFDDGTRFVLNRQAAAHQMWFAAGARAWHYDWDARQRRWVDDRDGHALAERIAGVVGEKLGRPVPTLE